MKKLLALLLALTCVFTLAFTACQNKTQDTDDTQNEQPDNTDNSGTQTPNGNNGNNNEGDGHQHNFKTTWTYNSKTHWHEATCHSTEKKDEAPHNYVDGQCATCKRDEVYEVGNVFPEFTVETFNDEGSFSSQSARGKVIVINFWYVNCGPCVSEMPEIEEVRKQYSDDVEVLALHSSGSSHAGDLAIARDFIHVNNPGNNNKTPWTNYGIIFGKDNANEDLYKKIGGDGYYPKTVVLDAEGKIVSIIHGNIVEFNMETHQYKNLLIPVIEEALGN